MGNYLNSRYGRIYIILKKLPKPVKEILLKFYWSLMAFWEDFNEYSIELIGHLPIHSIRLFWYRRICGMKIGENSSIHRNCRIYKPKRVSIGNNSIINFGVLLDGRSGLEICDNVSISECSTILTLGHDVDDPDFILKGGKVTINDYVFVGAYVRILPGVSIGEGAVIAVGSVVTKDIDPYSVVGGVPAKFIRNRNPNLRYQLNYRKRFG